MEDKDLYAILEVARGASQDDIRTSYRKLARKCHPDVNPNDKKAEDRFKEISFAYDVLSDEEKRKRYDEFGMQGLAEGFDPGHARAWARYSQQARRSPFHETFESDVDLEDLLSGFFGRGQARQRGPGRGPDAEGGLSVDFLEAVRGSEVRVQIQGRTLRVRIPPGAEDGSRIRVAGQGGPSPSGGPPGDLYLTLQVRRHLFYTRKGLDLYMDVPVTLPELVVGASVEVPTPWDEQVTIKVPARSRNGRVLRLRGKGVPKRGSEERGELYVKLVAQLPETDDPRLLDLAREMDSLYEGKDVRAALKGTT